MAWLLLYDQKFVQQINHVHVDEVHNVYTSGMKRNGFPAFRPAWGSLAKVQVRFPKGASWQALSATLPPHIFKVVDEKVSLSPSCHLIQLSVNWPNIMYAIHTLVSGLNNFWNLNCIIPRPFHPPMRLQKLLIVHDNKLEAKNALNHLNSHLPPELQSLSILLQRHVSWVSQQNVLEFFWSWWGNTHSQCDGWCRDSARSLYYHSGWLLTFHLGIRCTRNRRGHSVRNLHRCAGTLSMWWVWWSW